MKIGMPIAYAGGFKQTVEELREFEDKGVSRRTLFRWVDAAVKAWRPPSGVVEVVVPADAGKDGALHVVVELRISATPAAAPG